MAKAHYFFAITAFCYSLGSLFSLLEIAAPEIVAKVCGTLTLCVCVLNHSVLSSKNWFAVALIFCALGDGLLAGTKYMGEGKAHDNLFSFGLGGFLIGYLMYGVTSLRIVKPSLKRLLFIYCVIAVVGVAQFIFLYKFSKVKPMLIPLIAYFAQETLLVSAGVLVFASVSSDFSLYFLIGTINIYVSDSMIGFNVFRHQTFGEIPIMLTYLIGQVGVMMFVCLSEESQQHKDYQAMTQEST